MFRQYEPVIFLAYYTLNGQPVTTLTDVTADIYLETPTSTTVVQTNVPAQHVGQGFYKVVLNGLNVYGVLRALFTTSGNVDDQTLAVAVTYGQSWLNYLDAPISTRAVPNSVVVVNNAVPPHHSLRLYLDDNLTDLGNPIQFTFKNTQADLRTATFIMKIGNNQAVTGTASGTATEVTVVFEIPRSMKASWKPGQLPYQVVAIKNNNRMVMIDAMITVLRTL